MEDDVRQPLNRFAQDIEQYAKANVPVDSGDLKKSIKAKPIYKSNDEFSVEVTELAYGKYVKNNSFMKDAIEKSLQKDLPKITAALTNSVLNNILNK